MAFPATLINHLLKVGVSYCVYFYIQHHLVVPQMHLSSNIGYVSEVVLKTSGSKTRRRKAGQKFDGHDYMENVMAAGEKVLREELELQYDIDHFQPQFMRSRSRDN